MGVKNYKNLLSGQVGVIGKYAYQPVPGVFQACISELFKLRPGMNNVITVNYKKLLHIFKSFFSAEALRKPAGLLQPRR